MSVAARDGRRPRQRWMRRAVAAVGTVVLAAGLSGCTAPRWQSQLVSVNAAGTDSGNASSWLPVLSPDGTKVVFESNASNLGPNDTNGEADIYLRDLGTGVTTLVSVNAAGTDSGDDRSQVSSFSPDGSKLLFTSSANNLTPLPTGGAGSDLFVRDLAAGTTTLISVNAEGTGGGDAASEIGRFNADGSKVVFSSEADNLAPPVSEARSGVFERDLATGVTTRLADGSIPFYSPSGDVAFYNNGEVWLRDAGTGALTLVSSGLPGLSYEGLLAFSPDGTKLAFSRRTNRDYLRSDVYVYDLEARRAGPVTYDVDGNGGSNNTPSVVRGFHPTDSNLLLFTSRASNLVRNDTNGWWDDVFVRDLERGVTTLVSVDATGSTSASGFSEEAHWLGDGSKVAFVTTAANLGVQDTNSAWDVYVRDLGAGTYSLVSANSAGDDAGNGKSGTWDIWVGPGSRITYPRLSASADGTRIAFGSDAGDLGPTDSSRPWPSEDQQDAYVASLVTPPS